MPPHHLQGFNFMGTPMCEMLGKLLEMFVWQLGLDVVKGEVPR
jgi:hypothetical protein